MLNSCGYKNVVLKDNFTSEGYTNFLQNEYENLGFIFTDNQLPDINGLKIVKITK